MTENPEKPKVVFSLAHIDMEGVSDAAKLFLNKVSDAIGGGFRPWQIRRVAGADADAKVISAEADIRITDLQRRAAQRWLNEEAEKQENMERIAAGAVPQIKDDAKPNQIEKDWLTNFFDKARLTSDADMQKLWSAILAGEANAPGKFGKRAVNLMATLEKSDAEQFQKLCRFTWRGAGPIIFDTKSPIYTDNGVNWPALSHLDEIGLISFAGIGNFTTGGRPFERAKWFESLTVVAYRQRSVAIYPGAGMTVNLGHVKFSKAGDELAAVCGEGEAVAGYFEHTVAAWQSKGAKVVELIQGEESQITPEAFGIE